MGGSRDDASFGFVTGISDRDDPAASGAGPAVDGNWRHASTCPPGHLLRENGIPCRSRLHCGSRLHWPVVAFSQIALDLRAEIGLGGCLIAAARATFPRCEVPNHAFSSKD